MLRGKSALMKEGDFPAPHGFAAFSEPALLRALIDTVPDPIFCKDRHGRFLFVNRSNCSLFALDEADILGHTVHEIPGLKDFAALYHADDMEVMTSGLPVTNREEPFSRPDGRRGWFLTSKYPLRDEAGAVIGLVGIARDVSDVRRANDELIEARQRLVDHVENSPLAVIEWMPDFRVARWSGLAEEIFGWKSEEVVGRHFNEWPFVHQEDAAAVARVVGELMGGITQRNVCTNRNLNRKGEVVHCVWHNSVLHDSKGQVVSMLSLVQDVSERVHAEEVARRNQKRYETLVEATSTGYVVLDAEGRVLEANTEYIRLTGHHFLDEIRGRRVLEWTAPHHMERNAVAMSQCLLTGYIRNHEVDYRCPDGREMPVEMNARLIETAEDRHIVALCRDISGRREAEMQRIEFERKLQETQKLESLGVLAGGIAHDFNNLLTGVLGNASIAAAELPPDSPVMDCVEQIELAATRAADLCKQMLAYSGKGRFIVRHTQVNKIIRECEDLLRVSIGKSAALYLDLTDGLPTVLGDSAQIRQVVVNLVVNASEALGPEGGAIRLSTGLMNATHETFARAHLSPDLPPGQYVYIEVRDTGSGMEPDVQRRIFDPFFTTKFTGRGLGLAAVLGIVRGHHGAIIVESKSGRGSTFRVLFTEDAARADSEIVVPPGPASWRGRGFILLVDDEATIRRTASQMLRAIGFEVDVASDGIEGIEMFTANPDRYTVVLLDLTMPKLDGVAVFRSLRDLRPGVRVLLMSGYHEAEVSARFGADGPSGFVQKPFRLPDIREKLRVLLGGA